jgi:hypothetical protein
MLKTFFSSLKNRSSLLQLLPCRIQKSLDWFQDIGTFKTDVLDSYYILQSVKHFLAEVGFSQVLHLDKKCNILEPILHATVSYNASAVKIYNATSSPLRFENKNNFFYMLSNSTPALLW